MDIALDANGDIPKIATHVDGPRLVRQRIENRLNTHQGEWILDSREGLPYLEWAQTRPAPLEAIADAVRFELETTPGVAGLRTFDVSFSNRTVRVDATVVLESEEDVPLAIDVAPSATSITRVRIAR